MIGGRRIPEHEVRIIFVRASGPGGQNVNKTSTKAQLHWNVRLSSVFSEHEKVLILHALAKRINNDGDVVLQASETRSQTQNKETALERLDRLVNAALIPPTPRKKTKPTRASKERRLESKTRRSRIKQLRRALGE